MAGQSGRSTRVKSLGGVLIVIVGLLNFHVPHFVLERTASAGDTSTVLELVFVANLLGALIAAAGIWIDRRWGWLLGLAIVGLSFALYVAQVTVGLPGLPKNWWEPSRLVSVIVEVLFTFVARDQLLPSRREAQPLAREA